MILDVIKTIILGIIEGITEWLPISSTGHMILANEFLKLNVSAEFWEMFEVVIQLGAIFAVVVICFKDLFPWGFNKDKTDTKETFNLWGKIVVSSIPAAVIGLLFDDYINAHFFNAWTVAIMLIVYGVFFIIIERKHKGKRARVTDVKDVSYKDKKYSSVDEFTTSIENGAVAGIVVEDSYYQMLKEEYTNLSDTRVIKQYKVIVKKDNAKKQKVKETTKESFIVYISGIDTYGNISSVSRSDVNILAVVNPKTSQILLVSIPRDYYVQLHGTTGVKDKLTHAGIYGIDTSIDTINDLLDTKIDYFVRLNFSTLTKSIDLLDGIDVYSDREFTPWTNKNITIQKGMNHMDGETALAFARERHAYESGDRHRGENQQEIITAMINKMTDKNYITKYKDILTSLDGSFETSMKYEEMTNLFKMQINNNIKWNITSISLDGTGSMQSTYSMGDRKLYVMVPDDNTVNNAKENINKVLNGK